MPSWFLRSGISVKPGIGDRTMPESGHQSQKDLADGLGVSRLTVSDVIHEKRPVTPDMAMRLGRLLGNGPEIWLRMQQTLDPWELEQRGSYKHIEALKTAGA